MSRAVCCWCSSPLVELEGAWWCGNTGSDVCRRRQIACGTARLDGKGKSQVRHWLYIPTPVQTLWHEATLNREATRIGVGGAAGPGKSRFARETLYWFAQQVPGFHALLLRRTHKDLEQSHLAPRFMPHEVASRGGDYVKGPPAQAIFHHKGQADSVIRAGHMESDTDVQNYLSSEYDAIVPDETVTFQRDPMLELFSRARTTNPFMFRLRGLDHPDPDQRLDGSFVMCPTNPGGRGALWYRDFFVTHTVPRDEFPKYNPARWVFFQAHLRDNPYLAPGYRESLENLPEMRRRQLLEGDWDAFDGQFFGELRQTKDGQPYHAARVEVPSGVEWSCGMDWGFNAPGVIGWYASLADGHYHRAREYKFSGQTADQVATAFHRITAELGIQRVRYVAGDPAMWAKTGAGKGESIAETLLRRRVPMRKGDNDRFNGAMRVHEFFRDDGAGRPYLTVDPVTCPYWWRTLPSLVQDEHDPDDVDTTKDDHAYDETRYWAMSRPSPTRIVKDDAPGPGTWGYETQMAERLAQRQQAVVA